MLNKILKTTILSVFFLAQTASANAEILFVCTYLSPANEFTNIEGPACDKHGNVYAVSFGGKTGIGKVTPEGVSSLFVTLPDDGWGNGIRFASDGSMLIADYNKHRIFKVDMNTQEVSVLAHDPAWRQPNDIAITSTDVLFASDPLWSGNRKYGHIWRIDPDGGMFLAAGDADSLSLVNGIEVSPGDSILYVSNAVLNVGKTIMAYRILSDMTLTDQRVHFTLDGTASQTSDGMRCDMEGNLYITRPAMHKIDVVSPEGVLISSINTFVQVTPDSIALVRPTNLTFGGPDGRTCYVTDTLGKRIVSFRNDIPGRSWKMMQDNMQKVSEERRHPGIILDAGNTPNPFNPSTTLAFTLSSPQDVVLTIYTVTGAKVAVITEGHLPAGEHRFSWNAAGYTSGVYVWRLKAGNEIRSGKMLYLK